MGALFHSKTVQALSGWLTLMSVSWTILSKYAPAIFGNRTWPESIVIGIGLALATLLAMAVILAVGGYGFRLLVPLPATTPLPIPAEPAASATDSELRSIVDAQSSNLTAIAERLTTLEQQPPHDGESKKIEELEGRIASVGGRQGERISEDEQFVHNVLAGRRMGRECRELDEVVTRAANTLGDYRRRIRDAGEGELGTGPSVKSLVEDGLTSTMGAVQEAQRAVGIVDEPQVRRPDIQMTEDVDGERRFFPRNNGRFLDQHDDNAQILEAKTQALRLEQAKRNAELSRVRDQINNRLRSIEGENQG